MWSVWHSATSHWESLPLLLPLHSSHLLAFICSLTHHLYTPSLCPFLLMPTLPSSLFPVFCSPSVAPSPPPLLSSSSPPPLYQSVLPLLLGLSTSRADCNLPQCQLTVMDDSLKRGLENEKSHHSVSEEVEEGSIPIQLITACLLH